MFSSSNSSSIYRAIFSIITHLGQMADELQFFYIVKLKSLLQQTLCRKLLDGLLKAGNGFGHRDK